MVLHRANPRAQNKEKKANMAASSPWGIPRKGEAMVHEQARSWLFSPIYEERSGKSGPTPIRQRPAPKRRGGCTGACDISIRRCNETRYFSQASAVCLVFMVTWERHICLDVTCRRSHELLWLMWIFSCVWSYCLFRRFLRLIMF